MDLLLPRLSDPENKTALLRAVLPPKELNKLESEMGQMFYFTPTNPTGHYKLDMSKENDRKMMKQILQIGNDDKRWSKERSKRNDTSRDGDFEPYRNATYIGQPVKITGDFRLPGFDGFLEFDYVSPRTPTVKQKQKTLTSTKFSKFLRDLNLHEDSDFKDKPSFSAGALLAMFYVKKDLTELEGDKLQNAAASRLQHWGRQIVEYYRKSDAENALKGPTESERREAAAMKLQGWIKRTRRKRKLNQAEAKWDALIVSGQKPLGSEPSEAWLLRQGVPPVATGLAIGGAFGSLITRLKALKLAEERALRERIIVNGLMPLRRTVTKSILTCKQVAHVMKCFPNDAAGIEDARIQVLQSCFSRISDLHNLFPHILQDGNVVNDEDYKSAASTPHAEYKFAASTPEADDEISEHVLPTVSEELNGILEDLSDNGHTYSMNKLVAIMRNLAFVVQKD